MIAWISELAALLPTKIYYVGGYVRDSLLGLSPHDVDICGDIDPETVKSSLENTRFHVSDVGTKLFTLKIACDEGFCEYTAFRIDSYSEFHRPDSVKRTSDIRADALRRDFRANAVYIDVLSGEFVDPLSGLDDIKNRVLKMTRPETFSEDGLRLMRLCRQAAECNFDINPETLDAAKNNVGMLKTISPERIRDELSRILVADVRYGIKNAHTRGLNLLDTIGALEIILPELTLGKGMPQRADFHKYDVFGHIMATVGFSDPSVRLAALLHDIGKPYQYIHNGDYKAHDKEGARITEEVLSRLRYPNKIIKETVNLVYTHMFNLKCEARENTVRVFILNYRDILDKLFLLKQADFLGTGLTEGECPGVKVIKSIYDSMLSEGVPFTKAELKVNGEDAMNVGLRGKSICEALDALLKACAYRDSRLKDRESQLKFLEHYLKNGG